MRRIVVRMSPKAARDMNLREGAELTHAGRTGRVASVIAADDDDVLVEMEVDGPPSLLGVPGEPPGTDDA